MIKRQTATLYFKGPNWEAHLDGKVIAEDRFYSLVVADVLTLGYNVSDTEGHE